MPTSIQVMQPVENTDDPGLLVDLGDVANLTLGEGGRGREDKRWDYN